MLRQIAQRDDVPVHAGADRPLKRKREGASDFHGEEGLGFLTPFAPAKLVADGHAVDAILNTVAARLLYLVCVSFMVSL